MIRENWFSSPVYYEDLLPQEVDCDDVLKDCYAVREEDGGRKRSNIGGWQSKDLAWDYYDGIKKLVRVIEDKAKFVFEDYGVKEHIKPIVDNVWVNVNNAKDNNCLHNHPGTAISGVYYVKAPENCGKILFVNDPRLNFVNAMATNMDNSMTYGDVYYDPVPGRLLLFPSILSHMVEPNQSNEDRISIAFNIGIV